MLDRLEYHYIQGDALKLRYFLVPWDTRTCRFPVAQIDNISVAEAAQADREFSRFLHWRDLSQVSSCSCRLNSEQIQESLLLQRHGFYFVEMNFQPELNELQGRTIISNNSNEHIEIVPVSGNDIETIAGIAKKSFRLERFHIDPFLGRQLGNLRYETWVRNSFTNPKHSILKIMIKNIVVGFFIIENRPRKECYWHLTALDPEFQGRGLGRIVWKKVLQYVQKNGTNKIKTTISARNTAVMSIYSKLAFHFPPPTMTFHWHSQWTWAHNEKNCVS